MNKHKSVFWTKVFALGVLVSTPVLIAAARAEAQQPAEMEDMRRELRQLRSQVQALRAALSEAADLDAQRSAALSRALKSLPASPEPTASKSRDDAADKSRVAAAAAPSTPAPVIVPPPAPPPATATRSSRHRAQEAAAAAGVVRGRVSVPKGEPVAYVYVENVPAPAVKGERVVIEQVGKRFVPSWAVVQRGTSILFPNRDNIYHNVFSLSSGNSFDLGIYSSAQEAKSYTFNEAGEVEIYCNIHPQMSASALVVPNRLFAKVKGDGSFEIGGVPGGKRKIVAWAPGSGLTATWVDVEAGANAQVDMKLEPRSSGHKNKTGQQYGSYE